MGAIKKVMRYPQEIRDQAIGMFKEARPAMRSNVATAKHVTDLLGIGCVETVLAWVKQARIDEGKAEGLTTGEHDEIRKLKRENAELKRANGILRAASAFFAAELDRPPN
jgi:transposase